MVAPAPDQRAFDELPVHTYAWLVRRDPSHRLELAGTGVPHGAPTYWPIRSPACVDDSGAPAHVVAEIGDVPEYLAGGPADDGSRTHVHVDDILSVRPTLLRVARARIPYREKRADAEGRRLTRLLGRGASHLLVACLAVLHAAGNVVSGVVQMTAMRAHAGTILVDGRGLADEVGKPKPRDQVVHSEQP